jgi:hypothetical protein
MVHMTDFLVGLFVKNHHMTSDPAVRGRIGNFAAALGIVTNILLFGVKILVGTISGSIAVTADAFNNLSDSGASLIALIGFRISGKPADSGRPFRPRAHGVYCKPFCLLNYRHSRISADG